MKMSGGKKTKEKTDTTVQKKRASGTLNTSKKDAKKN